MTSTSATITATTSKQLLGTFVSALAAKVPTPGGGAAAAVGASLGGAAAHMAANFTMRKKDKESGASLKAEELILTKIDLTKLLDLADDDAKAYEDLQRTWKKDSNLTEEEKRTIEQRALEVPVTLLELCHKYICSIQEFLPHCNPNITSDAKVGIHQLAGAARSAYQTALVNSPPQEEKQRLQQLLKEIQTIENDIIDMGM